MKDCKEKNYGPRAQFLKPSSPPSSIAGPSGYHAVVFVVEPSSELLLCKLFSNSTPIAYAPFIFEREYVTCMPPLASVGLALLQRIHLRGPPRRRGRRLTPPRKTNPIEKTANFIFLALDLQ